MARIEAGEYWTEGSTVSEQPRYKRLFQGRSGCDDLICSDGPHSPPSLPSFESLELAGHSLTPLIRYGVHSKAKCWKINEPTKL